jgi:hypothetical protein
MARNSAKEENLLSRLGGIRNAVDETKKLRAENERLREALGVKERMQASGAMAGPLAGILEAHFPAADWLLSTDPKSVPPDVWNREMAGVHTLLFRLRDVAERSVRVLHDLIEAEKEFAEFDAELTASEAADHEGGPPDTLLAEHAAAHTKRETARKAAGDLLAEMEAEEKKFGEEPPR